MAGPPPRGTPFPADLDLENQFRRRQYFLSGVQIQGLFKMPRGAALNYLMVCQDAYGVGQWQSAATVSTGALADYWYKPGIAGSFTAYMRTTSGGSGIISSTAHATKGFIYLGAVAALDEANGLFGVGTLTPAARVHLVAAASGSALTTSSDISGLWAPDPTHYYTGAGTPVLGNHSGALASNDGTTSYIAILGDGTNGTNPEKLGLSGAVAPNTVYTVSISLFCLGGTMTAGSNFIVSLVSSAGLKYASATLDLVGIGTSPTVVNFTVNTGGTSTGSGTANSVELSASCVPTTFYTCVSYLTVSSGGGDLIRWDNSSGTQLGRLNNSGYLGLGTGIDTLSAMLTIKNAVSTQQSILLKAHASQSVDIIKVQTSAGTDLYTFGPATGVNFIATSSTVGTPAYIQAVHSAGSYARLDSGSTTGAPTLTLNAVSGNIPTIIGSNSAAQIRLGTNAGAGNLYALNIGVNGAGTVAVNPNDHASAASIPLTVYGSTAQSGHLYENRTVAAAILSGFLSSGDLFLGDTSGASYYKLVPGDDLVVQDDAGLNLLTIRDVTTWADSVAGYQMLPGNAAPTNRNLVISGFSPSGSVFDRLGFQVATSVWWDSTAASLPAPTATPGLIELRTASTAKILLKLIPIASGADIIQVRTSTDSASTFSVGNTGQTTIRASTAIPSLIIQRSAAGATEILNILDSGGTKRFVISTAGRASFNTSSVTGWVNVAPNDITGAALSTTFSGGVFAGIAGSTNTGGIWRLGGTISGDGVDDIGNMAWLRIAPTVTEIAGTHYPIEVAGSYTLNSTAAAGTFAGLEIDPTVTITVSAANTHSGIRCEPGFVMTAASLTSRAMGFQNNASGAGNTRTIQGAVGTVAASGSGTIADIECVGSACSLASGTGAVTSLEGLWFSGLTVPAGVTVTSFHGARVSSNSNAGTITNSYGLKIDSGFGVGTNNWGIYQEDNIPSFFRGKVGVGLSMSAPTANVDLAAGTTALAPLRFNSGTSLTTPLAGIMEFTTDDLFFTITTGAARKALVLDDGARLTLGKTPKATTNGRLIDGSPYVGTPLVAGDDPPAVASGALGKVDLTAQTADIGSTNLTNTPSAGKFLITCVLEDTTADVTAGTVTATFSWTDDVGATTRAVTQSLIATGRQTDAFAIYVASGNISYATTHTGIFGTSTYAIRIRVVALG